jgi:BirA family transcriptional regulator, biotin operon repressor / biotin---[acetyl-CoA-carboxylase] ligase
MPTMSAAPDRIADMSRTPPALDEQALGSALTYPAGLFRRVSVVVETGSTNADLAAHAAADPAAWPDLSVLIADSQIAGKGRLDRSWQVPAGDAMISSVLLRPSDPAVRLGAPAFNVTGFGWLSILAGVALCQAVREVTAAPAVLKWPNDVLLNGRKLAGILAQIVPATPSSSQAGPGVVVGAGVNISQEREQLPVDRATSLALEVGTGLDRNILLPAYLNRFARLYQDFVAVGGDALQPLSGGASVHDLASGLMATLGTEVRAELPGGTMLHGTAARLGAGGELEIRDGDGVHTVTAGDVVHLRRTGHGGVGYA